MKSMFIRFILSGMILFAMIDLHAQPGSTCNPLYTTNPSKAIADLGLTRDTISISGSGITLSGLHVYVNLNHTWINDLTITLTSPANTVVSLTAAACAGEDNMDVEYSDFATDPAGTNCPPIGVYEIPNTALSAVNGEALDGDWILSITDGFAGDIGTLNTWCLIPNPPVPGDNCGNAIDISATGTFNTGPYTGDPAPSCGTGAARYYTFTAPSNGDLTVETCGLTTEDTQLATFTGTCGSLLLSQCIVDACSTQETVTETMSAGETIYVVWTGANSPAAHDFNVNYAPAVGAECGTYTSNPALAIPDNDTVTDIITVSGTYPEQLTDLNVFLDITHTYIGDLTITLTSPSNTTVTLVDGGNGCTTEENMEVEYDDSATDPGGTNCPPITVFEMPFEALSAFNGENFDGDWTLTIIDAASPDPGVLNSWCLIPELVLPPPGADCGAYASSPSKFIPSSTTTRDTITVTGTTPQTLTDLDVYLDITHTFIGDLTITLTSPANTTVTLVSSGGGCAGADNMDVQYDDEVSDPSGTTCPPIGVYEIPASALSAFDGESFDGDWILAVTDGFAGDDGTLNSWCLLPTLFLDPPGTACGPYSSSPATPIVDGLIINDVITVAGTGPQTVGDLNVYVDITHTRIGDLTITLESPIGTIVTLVTSGGGCTAEDNMDVEYDDEATDFSGTNCPPIGVYEIPSTALWAFDGEIFEGDWTIRVADNGIPNQGTLNSWCLIPQLVSPPPGGQCGTYTSSPATAIPDNTSITDVIAVSGTSPELITDLNVYLDITHTFIGDLTVTLTSPANTVVTLVSSGGGCSGADNMDVEYDDEATDASGTTCPPIGVFEMPSSALSAFDGESFDGNWTLTVSDGGFGDTGTLNSWCMIPSLALPAPGDDCGTYSSAPSATLANPGTTTDVITVTGTDPQFLTDLNVYLDITHPFIEDITVTLTSPASTVVNLVVNGGGCTGVANFDVEYDDAATDNNGANCPPVGVFEKPFDLLSAFNGETFDGDWTLAVTDPNPLDGGTLNSWCLIPTLATPAPGDDCGTYTSSPGTPTVDNSSISDVITVSGTTPQVLTDLNVYLDITHSYIGDLTVTLNSPGNTDITLVSSGNGCGSVDNMDVEYDDQATDAAGSNCPPLAAFEIPFEALGFLDGETFDGDWTLTVADGASGDGGTLNSWCLIPTLGPPPACPNVTGLTATSTATSTVDIAWNPAVGATNYLWEIQNATDPQGFAPAIASGSGPDTSATATGAFVVGNEYTLYVASDCSGLIGNYVSLNFTHTPPPANDDCSGAIALSVGSGSCESPSNGSNVYATDSGVAHSCASYSDQDVWFSAIVPASGELIVEVSNSVGFSDGGMQAYSGTCGSLVSIECDDDDGPGLLPRLELSGRTPGEVIYFAVWEFGGGSEGTFDICAWEPPPPIANDDCSGAIAVTTSIFGEPGWQVFSNASATNSGVASCVGNEDDDIWFSFVAQSSNDAVIARGDGIDMVIEIFDGCGGTQIACEDNTLSGEIERSVPGGLVIGATYYFRVYHYFSGAGGGSVEVQVKTYEDSQLQSQYCNETYDLSQSIYSERDDLGQLYSNPNVPVKGYRFHFEEQGGGLSVDYSNPGETPYLTLASVPGLEYGKTYDVSVSHRVKMRANGSIFEYWSQYGTPCPITIQADVPTTQLIAEFCPATEDLYLEDQIQAVPVPGADQYRFTFDGPGGPFVESSNNYAMFLYTVGPFGGPGLQYGSSVYNVSVEVQVNGAWSVPGTPCMITMASEPENTEVQGSDCGGTFLYPDPNYILAQYVYGANGYEWEWTPTSGQSGGTQTTTTDGISLAFHTTDLDLSEGGSWDVRVRALADGQNGSFSTVCVINITPTGPIAPPSDDVSDIKAMLMSDVMAEIYPNPTHGDQVAIHLSELSDENQSIVIEVIEQTGKVILTDRFSNKGVEATYILDFENELATGLYFVNLYINDVRLTKKLMVQR